ncbi:MAG: methylmalonyl-CoA epimerase [Pseudomonadales bacterium]|jgi:methylmalonyl-CoA epimerase|nr:methylmalonyl-CoA epimerase [Pseudomonadales bacterium]
MITGLDHIAVAVPDLEAAIRRFAEDFGLSFEGTEDVQAARTRTAFFPVPATSIELVHPLNGEGAIAKYLSSRPGGLHHLCFRTDDIDADVERLAARGYRFLSDTPQPGAHGTRTIFIHPKCCDGVLVELAEHPRGAAHE